MHLETRNPVAAATATRLRDIIWSASNTDLDTLEASFPQAAIIARKYHLTPLRARLVADLAGLGPRTR